MSIIVGLLGVSKSGKDECGKTFIKHGFNRYAFGDEVKHEYARQNNLPDEEMFNHRKDFHRPGIINHGESKRKEKPTYWVDIVNNQAIEDLNNNKNVVITDIRRVPEIDYIQNLKAMADVQDKVYLIHIERPKSNGGEFDNDAETALAVYYANFNEYIDLKISNASTDADLADLVDDIITQIILKNNEYNNK